MATGLVSTSWIYQQFSYVFCSTCKLLMQHMNVQLLLDKYDFICACIMHIQLLLLSHENIFPQYLQNSRRTCTYNIQCSKTTLQFFSICMPAQTRMFAVDYSSITMEREEVNLLRSSIWFLISDFISADRQSTYYFCLPCNSFLFSYFFLVFFCFDIYSVLFLFVLFVEAFYFKESFCLSADKRNFVVLITFNYISIYIFLILIK